MNEGLTCKEGLENLYQILTAVNEEWLGKENPSIPTIAVGLVRLASLLTKEDPILMTSCLLNALKYHLEIGKGLGKF